MNGNASRPPVVVLLNRRRGSGSQSTLPARKPVQSDTRLNSLEQGGWLPAAARETKTSIRRAA